MSVFSQNCKASRKIKFCCKIELYYNMVYCFLVGHMHFGLIKVMKKIGGNTEGSITKKYEQFV